MEELPPLFFCNIAFMTKKNTRTGATPLSAFTNKLPKIETKGISPGAKQAIPIPINKPIAICLISEIEFKHFMIVVNNFKTSN